MSGRPARQARVLAAAFLVAASLSSAESTAVPRGPAPSAPPPAAQAGNKLSDTKPADLKEARSRLSAASSPAEYAAMLDSFSTSLPPSDALALLDQGVAGAAQEYRRALLVKAADLDLLLGLFGDAAERYEAAASAPSTALPPTGASPASVAPAGVAPAGARDAALLLRSARCSIAAGEAEKAQALAADIVMTAGDPDLVASARLVGAWALLMQDRHDDAATLASAVAGAEAGSPADPGADRRREARFLLWLCASGEGKAAAATKLASEFPGSPEALIAAGSAAAPPLPHWYLGPLSAVRNGSDRRSASSETASAPVPAAVPAQAASSSPAAAPTPATGASAQAARSKRLQVGYFSLEDNAQALKSELSSKGFAAAIEVRIRAAEPGKAEEKRWIVVVDGGKDLSGTLQRLKDAGYESYVID